MSDHQLVKLVDHGNWWGGQCSCGQLMAASSEARLRAVYQQHAGEAP